MRKWTVVYCVGNTYKHKHIVADTAEKAAKKARIKNIVDLFPVEERRTTE